MTGIVLAMHYVPNANLAFDSVENNRVAAWSDGKRAVLVLEEYDRAIARGAKICRSREAPTISSEPTTATST